MKDSERSELFARARREATPSMTDQRRVRSALARRLAGAAGAVAGSTTAIKAAASVAPAIPAAPVAAAAAVGGVTIVGALKVAVVVGLGFALVSVATPAHKNTTKTAKVAITAPAPRPASQSLETMNSVPPPPEPEVAAPLVNPPIAAVQAPPKSQPAVVAAPSTPVYAAHAQGVAAAPLPLTPAPAAAPRPDPAAELELLARMQSALKNGDSALTLSLVAEHERRFPESTLTPERDGARVLAICLHGEPNATRAAGEAFLGSHPRSPLAGRVRATCGVTGQ